MTSKDVQDIVLSRYQDGDTSTNIFRHITGRIDLGTIKRCCQMIRQFGSNKVIKSIRLFTNSENQQKHSKGKELLTPSRMSIS